MSLEEDELERRLPNTHDWQTMSPGEKMAWLLNQALDVKRDILTSAWAESASIDTPVWSFSTAQHRR